MSITSLSSGQWKNYMPDIDDRLKALENKNMIYADLNEKETVELRVLTSVSYSQMPMSKEQKLRLRYLKEKASSQQAALAENLKREKEEAIRLERLLKIPEIDERLEALEIRLDRPLKIPEIDERLEALEKVANSTNLPALEALVKTIQEKLEKVELVKEEKQEVYHAEEEGIQYVYFLTLPILVLLLATILQKFLPKTYNEINPNMLLL
jgi:hypothetical protein